MNLIIDQGNTALKIALFEGDKLISKAVIENNQPTDLAEWLQTQVTGPVNSITSSVVNQELDLSSIQINSALKLNSKIPLPIEVDYKSPETLGNDRLANACGIWKLNPKKNSLAIDLGTCIKYDLVTAEGIYKGGAISPGLAMRYRSLHEFTAKLPLIQNDQTPQVIGTDTKSSLVSGVELGISYEINGFIERYSEDFSDLTIFMTGGDLNHFDKGIKNRIFANPDLTLIGLNEILQFNVQQK
ncbi:MAG: type III pantothenate kinase [Crocinitomicaceae bacterium]|nr:type III pantothenate kinase [Crocinitomicaceae bacterium]